MRERDLVDERVDHLGAFDLIHEPAAHETELAAVAGGDQQVGVAVGVAAERDRVDSVVGPGRRGEVLRALDRGYRDQRQLVGRALARPGDRLTGLRIGLGDIRPGLRVDVDVEPPRDARVVVVVDEDLVAAVAEVGDPERRDRVAVATLSAGRARYRSRACNTARGGS